MPLAPPDPKSRYKQGTFIPKHYTKYSGANILNVVYRSGWERDFMKYLDENANVIAWASESIRIPYKHPITGEMANYYPDFWFQVKEKDGSIKTIIAEIKPLAQTKEPEKKIRVSKKYLTEVVTYGINEAKFEAARKFCQEQGWEFIVLTEKELGK